MARKKTKKFAETPTAAEREALTTEVAREETWERQVVDGGRWVLNIGDRVVASKFSGDYEQYRTIYNDAQVMALWTARRNRLLGIGYSVVVDGAQSDERLAEIEAFCNAALADIDCLNGILAAMMNAIVEGFKVVEIVWRIDPDGIRIGQLLVKPSQFFRFDRDGRMYWRTARAMPLKPIEDEAYKFVVLSHLGGDNDRHGYGIGEALYWPVWQKKENVRFWMVLNERAGGPIWTARVSAGKRSEEMDAIGAELRKVKGNTVLVTREGFTLEPVQINVENFSRSFDATVQFCNNEIAKVIASQNMTSGDSQQSGGGARAAVQVGASTEASITRADAKLIEEAMTKVVRWMVDMNFGSEYSPLASFRFALESANIDPDRFSLVIQRIANGAFSLPVSMRRIREGLSLPPPINEEDAVVIGGAIAQGAPAVGDVASASDAIPPSASGGAERPTRLRNRRFDTA